MFTWSLNLIQEIAERRCIFVLGAGVSAGSESSKDKKKHPTMKKRPCTWAELLREGASRVHGASAMEIRRLIDQGKYLDAAQILVDSMPAPDFAYFLRKELQDPCFLASPIHSIVFRIDPKIIITTNFDAIIESYYVQNNTFISVNKYYDPDVLDQVRANTRLLLKVHGCINAPMQVMLTRTQYNEAKKRYSAFYNTLNALFMTRTVLFIGCGLADPDIQLLLEAASAAAPCGYPHYAVVEAGRHPSLRGALEKTCNITLLEYENKKGDHRELMEALSTLEEEVQSTRCRAVAAEWPVWP
jgi:hypothetical protein